MVVPLLKEEDKRPRWNLWRSDASCEVLESPAGCQTLDRCFVDPEKVQDLVPPSGEGDVLDRPFRKEPRGHLWAWEGLGVLPEEPEKVARKRSVWASLLRLLPQDQDPDEQMRTSAVVNETYEICDVHGLRELT